MTTAGHLRLPNDLVEALARLRLNGTQWQILWGIWRRTLCWQKSGEWSSVPYPIGVCDLVEATGINKAQVKREMAALVELNLILRDKALGGRGHKPLTSFNLDISTWRVVLGVKGSGNDTLTDIKGSGSDTLSHPETVAETLPLNPDNSSGNETLTDIKGSGNAPQRVAEMIPITRGNATLSPRDLRLGKKHINKLTTETGTEIVENIWTAAKELLRGQVNTSNYHTWLEHTVGRPGSNGAVVIFADTQAVADYLRNNLRSLIEKTIADLAGREVPVMFMSNRPVSAGKG